MGLDRVEMTFFRFYNDNTSINEGSGDETLYCENRPSAKQKHVHKSQRRTFVAL